MRTKFYRSVKRPRVTLRNATEELFNDDGKVNTNSPLFEGEGTRYDPSVDYKKVIGASRILPQMGKFVSESYAEISGSEPSEEAINLGMAQKGLEGLANDLLQFSTNQSDDRVLKFVQELFAEEVEKVRPGGLLYKTDADAVATLQGMSDTITGTMRTAANMLPEYGGDSSGYYGKTSNTGLRRDMLDL
jgi:hypothetical protein